MKEDFDISDKVLKLCQIPHHGSISNHEPEFWRDLKHESACPAVISAGEHKKYNHPHLRVVSDFNLMNYRICATNNVNGMKEFINTSKELELSLLLDTDSEIIEEYNIDGDQIFKITKDR